MSLRKRKKRVLITLGPTRAYLDSVRYLSNYSTGELGYKIAERLIENNFEVAIVAGPIAFDLSKLKIKKIENVITVDEMRSGALKLCSQFKPDYFLPVAAVLDFVPKKAQKGKVSSKLKSWNLELVPTKKIIDEVRNKYPRIKSFGFKLEVGAPSEKKIRQNAEKIIKEKKLEGLCLNFLDEITSKKHPAWLFNKEMKEIRLKTKAEIASFIARALTY